MTVAHILALKGRDVATIGEHETVRDAAEQLAAKHIGSLVVCGRDGAMQGILSERDVVRAIARRGCDALDDNVTDIMTRDVTTATEEESVIGVVGKMSRGRFRHMPIVEDGRLVGMVSTGDAIKYRLEQMEQEHSALREYIATA
jgi:CBS domain-containing protein